VTTSNPFERLLPAAMDGNDMNPLLQDWGMIIHPPMLYMVMSVSPWPLLSPLPRCSRQDGRRLGALVAAVDHGGLGFSYPRHHAGQLVGLP